MNKSDNKTLPDYPEVLMLTGAGISIPLGIPAMHGMFTAFMSQKKSTLPSSIKKTCKFMTNELKVPHDLEEFLVAANSIAEFRVTHLSPLIEKSISRSGQSKNIIDYRKRLSKYCADAESVRSSILEFMARKCFQFDRPKAEVFFAGLVGSLSTKGYPVYTTNYDFSFEHVAQENKIAIHDNFVRNGQRDLWDEKIKFHCGDGLTMIKLHGSVTWYKNKDNTIEKIYAHTNINPIGEEIDRIVIAPTRFKDIYDQNFFALYSHFLTNLSQAKVLIIAGHSMRDDYLRAAIVERSRNGNFNLVVIDPNFPTELSKELQPARIGTSGLVTHIPLKFEEFSDELGNVLLTEEPENIANQCAEIIHHSRARTNKISIKGKIGALRANTKKTFVAKVSCYLERKEKPARIRVWLEAQYSKPDGTKHSKVSGTFLETKDLLIGENLSGMIDAEIPIEFEIPEYKEWVDYASKVTLNVAIAKPSIKKPSNLHAPHIVASDGRMFNYSK